MSQNCTIIKILLHFGPVLCKITSLRTLFGGDILISGEKYVFKHVLLSRKVQKSSWFKILCSFHPFCPIQRVHLGIFLKYNMSKFTFWGWTIDFLGNICPQTCCITKKGSKMQLDFEYCAVWTYSAQSRWLVWPFFGIITCLRSIFRSFWGWSFDFWRDIWHLICCIANKWSKIAEFIPQIGASAKYV